MLTVRISDESRHAIEEYCAAHGITVTGWVEAVGRRIQELQSDKAAGTILRKVADETVEIARTVDRERRSRQRRSGSDDGA